MSLESEFIRAIIDSGVRATWVNRDDKVGAGKKLRYLVVETRKAGFALSEFEARLVLAQTEIALGNSGAGRADLSDLAKEASANGFGMIFRKTKAILQARSSAT